MGGTDVSLRTCIGCGAKKSKDALVRLTLGPEGAVVDESGRAPGRGAYICPAQNCVTLAIKRGRLARALKSGRAGDMGRLKPDIIRKSEKHE